MPMRRGLKLARGERRLGESRKWQMGEGKRERGEEGGKTESGRGEDRRVGRRRRGLAGLRTVEQRGQQEHATKVSVSPRSV